MKTTTRIQQRPRWPEPLGPRFLQCDTCAPKRTRTAAPDMPVLPPEAGNDFLILNPNPELLAPEPPPPDLTFFNIDFP